jgi:hypothetical protein
VPELDHEISFPKLNIMIFIKFRQFIVVVVQTELILTDPSKYIFKAESCDPLSVCKEVCLVSLHPFLLDMLKYLITAYFKSTHIHVLKRRSEFVSEFCKKKKIVETLLISLPCLHVYVRLWACNNSRNATWIFVKSDNGVVLLISINVLYGIATVTRYEFIRAQNISDMSCR